MPILEKLRNIFAGSGDNKKKVRHYQYIKRDADPSELWEIIGELGDGAFGKVYKAHQKDGSIEAALKQVEIADETELEEYSVEIDILSQCRHKNIVGIYESYYFNNKLCMYIEFCGGGAVDSIMQELEKPLTEPQIRCICHEMCEALDFLHQHFVIHRDLKAGNVLLTADGQVRLADFGVSAKNASSRQRRDSFIGTPYWMAPEVIMCETVKDRPYNFKADIWSFGITLIEFAEVNPPNHEMHPMRVFIKIQKSSPPKLSQPNLWSAEFKDFIAQCLVKDPDQRLSASDLLEHAFIRDVCDMQPLIELVSEANAEVVYEEKDIDEVDDLASDTESIVDTDLDSLSLSSAIISPDSTKADVAVTVVMQNIDTVAPSQQMGSEIRPGMIQVITDKVGKDEVTAADQSAVHECGGEILDLTLKCEDHKDLVTETELADISEQDQQVPCRTGDTMRLDEPAGETAQVCETSETGQVAQESSDDVATGGEVTNNVLDETITALHDAAAATGQKVIVDKNVDYTDHSIVSTNDSVTTEPTGAHVLQTDDMVNRTAVTESVMPLPDSKLRISDASSTGSDAYLTAQIDSTADDVSDGKAQLDGAVDATTVVVKDDVEKGSEISSAEEAGGLLVLTEDQSSHRSCTLAESADPCTVITASDVDDLSADDSVQLSDETHRTHESVLAEERRLDHTEVESLIDAQAVQQNDPEAERLADAAVVVADSDAVKPGDAESERLADAKAANLADDDARRLADDEAESVADTEATEGHSKVSHKGDVEDSVQMYDRILLVSVDEESIVHPQDSADVNLASSSQEDAELSSAGPVATAVDEPDMCLSKSTIVVMDAVQDSVDKATELGSDGGHVSVDEVNNIADVSVITNKGNEPVDACVEMRKEQDVDELADVKNSSACGTESSHEAVTALVTESDEVPSNVGKSDGELMNAENSVQVDTALVNSATCDISDASVNTNMSSSEDVCTQQELVNTNSEKARLYAKNIKSESPGTGRAAHVKDSGKLVKPGVQNVKVSIDQPHQDQTVVLRKKLSPAEDTKSTDETDAGKVHKGKTTRKTLTKTRKFVVNGVMMTSQTSKIVADEMKKQQEHQLWKADLRELKRLHVQENRLMQALAGKALTAKEEQLKKFEIDKQMLLRTHDTELDHLLRQNRQLQEKLSATQVAECKALQKKLKAEQERDLKTFHEGLKQDMKLMKQSVDMLPKDMRKDLLRQRREEKDVEQADKERQFLEKQAADMENAMKRLSEQHREKVALYEKQHLQQKHQLKREQETAIIELEKRQLLEKKQLEDKQLKEKFILQRQLLMTRQAKEMDQIKRINSQKEEEMQQCHLQERKRLPKILKADTKTRTMMYRESLRIVGGEFSLEEERERLKQFDESEKKRMKQETLRLEAKQTRQISELKTKNEAILKELDEVYLEKLAALLENETQKSEELISSHQTDMDSWSATIEPRQQSMEEEFALEFAAFEKFYSSSEADCPPYPTGNSTATENAAKSHVGVRGSMVL